MANEEKTQVTEETQQTVCEEPQSEEPQSDETQETESEVSQQESGQASFTTEQN